RNCVLNLSILEPSIQESSCAKQNRNADHARLHVHGGQKFFLMLKVRKMFTRRIFENKHESPSLFRVLNSRTFAFIRRPWPDLHKLRRLRVKSPPDIKQPPDCVWWLLVFRTLG